MSTTTPYLHDVLTLAELERPGWNARLHELRASGVPLNEGGDDDDAAAAAKKAEEEAAAEAAAEAARRAEEALGDAGKAALAAERKRARDAEKALKEAQAKLKEREDADLTETERLKKQVEDAQAKVGNATDKLRRANLLAALADEGLTGAKAKAAARLLDVVEYGNDDEPTNLADAITAAKAEYGDDMFKGATPARKPTPTNGGGGREDREGPTLTADELAAAKAAGMTPEEYEAYKSPQPQLSETKQ